jgi:hypothetical protein
MTSDNNKALRAALDHLQQGDWAAAHKIVQSDDSAIACWIHGIVHVMEGDLDNARYWYGRAGRVFAQNAVTEIGAAREMLN